MVPDPVQAIFRWQRRICPALIEEVYTLEDALVVAQFLNSFIRHADVLKIACLAQIVNAIAPLLTVGDDILKQPTYWAFRMFAHTAQKTALTATVTGDVYETPQYGKVPVLDTSATLSDDRMTIFCVNRHKDPIDISVRVDGVALAGVEYAEVLSGPSLDSTNSLDTPDRVSGVEFGDVYCSRDGGGARLPGHSISCMIFNLT